MTTRILIADSSSLTIVGVETLLKQRGDTHISKAQNGDYLVQQARAEQPDIVLLGDRFDPLADTLALIERLIRASPAARIIVMGATIDGLFIRDLFKMGVCGYLATGDDLSACMLVAIDTVLKEYPYLSPTANAEYLIAMQGGNRDWELDSESRTVLRFLSSGSTPREIAAQMKLKLRRVYWVIEKTRKRFGASTNEHLIMLANAEGFTGFTD